MHHEQRCKGKNERQTLGMIASHQGAPKLSYNGTNTESLDKQLWLDFWILTVYQTFRRAYPLPTGHPSASSAPYYRNYQSHKRTRSEGQNHESISLDLGLEPSINHGMPKS